MALTIDLVLAFLAFLAFVLAAIGVQARVNLMATGLALWVLTLIL